MEKANEIWKELAPFINSEPEKDEINGYDIAFDGYWLPCVPGVFSYVEPTNSATSVSLNADLDWDDSVVADSYDVYFGTSSPPLNGPKHGQVR